MKRRDRERIRVVEKKERLIAVKKPKPPVKGPTLGFHRGRRVSKKWFLSQEFISLVRL